METRNVSRGNERAAEKKSLKEYIIIDLVDLLDGHRFEAFTEAEKDIFDKSISEKIKKYKSCSKSVNVLSIKCIAAIVALHFRIEEKSNVRGMDLQFDGKKYIQTPRT